MAAWSILAKRLGTAIFLAFVRDMFYNAASIKSRDGMGEFPLRMAPAVRTEGDGHNLYCTAEGLFLGAGYALIGSDLGKSAGERFCIRPLDELNADLGEAFGTAVDLSDRMATLRGIAKALEDGDLSRALIGAAHLEMPALLDAAAAMRLRKIDALRKYGYDPSEPRDRAGLWTREGSGAGAASLHADERQTAEAEPASEVVAHGHIPKQVCRSDGSCVTITFKNDDPTKPSPDQPVMPGLRDVVAQIAKDSSANSLNINSTTGGKHLEGSDHYAGAAVDINSINGKSVIGQGASADVTDLENAAAANPNVRYVCGPARCVARAKVGGPLVPAAGEAHHDNHIHISVFRNHK